MKRSINVHSGEVMAGKEETVLKSDANNECMVIVAYDSIHKVGGLAHAMFAGFNGKRRKFTTIREAEEAIDEMIKDMSILGSGEDDIEVCLVAAENLKHEKEDPVIKKSFNEVTDILKKKHIRFSHVGTEDIGKHHVAIDVETGDIQYN